VVPLAMKIMDESVTVAAEEQYAFAERLMAMRRRLEERGQRTVGEVVAGVIDRSVQIPSFGNPAGGTTRRRMRRCILKLPACRLPDARSFVKLPVMRAPGSRIVQVLPMLTHQAVIGRTHAPASTAPSGH
jgi:hypothetical protein